MLTDVLTGLAVSGSAAAAVCLLLRRAARGRLSARWEYGMAKLSLVFALVPLGQLLPWTGKLVRSFGAAGTGAAASAAPAPHGGTAALPAVLLRRILHRPLRGPSCCPGGCCWPWPPCGWQGPCGCWYGGCGPVRR